MLRVGLTGGLGSGKSTAARRFAELGAHVLYADEIGRELMQPGQAVYAAIVEQFGPQVVLPDRTLNRAELARIAFAEGRIEELNAIVHPATIAGQATRIEEIGRQNSHAIVIVESALIFETKYGGEDGWHRRFDTLILVRAPEVDKIERFVSRASSGRMLSAEAKRRLEQEARRRLALQIDDSAKASRCDYVLTNDGPIEELLDQVDALWVVLKEAAKK